MMEKKKKKREKLVAFIPRLSSSVKAHDAKCRAFSQHRFGEASCLWDDEESLNDPIFCTAIYSYVHLFPLTLKTNNGRLSLNRLHQQSRKQRSPLPLHLLRTPRLRSQRGQW